MARVKLLEKDQALPEAQELYGQLEKNGTIILNLYKTAAHSPRAMRNFIRLGNSLLTAAELSPKLREMVILRIAGLTGSEYEWAQHYPIALEVGVTKKQAEAVSDWKNSELFTDEEKAVLQYTDEVSQNIQVKDETFKELGNYLNERSIVELTLSIGYWGMVARLLVPLQVEIDTQSVSSAKDLMGKKD